MWIIIIIPKHCFRLIEGQQYHCWSEKSLVVGLEPPTLGIQGRRLRHSSTEPHYWRFFSIKSSKSWNFHFTWLFYNTVMYDRWVLSPFTSGATWVFSARQWIFVVLSEFWSDKYLLFSDLFFFVQPSNTKDHQNGGESNSEETLKDTNAFTISSVFVLS